MPNNFPYGNWTYSGYYPAQDEETKEAKHEEDEYSYYYGCDHHWVKKPLFTSFFYQCEKCDETKT